MTNLTAKLLTQVGEEVLVSIGCLAVEPHHMVWTQNKPVLDQLLNAVQTSLLLNIKHKGSNTGLWVNISNIMEVILIHKMFQHTSKYCIISLHSPTQLNTEMSKHLHHRIACHYLRFYGCNQPKMYPGVCGLIIYICFIKIQLVFRTLTLLGIW